MATFVTIGYGDSAGYQRTTASARDAAHAQDTRLRAMGAVMGSPARLCRSTTPKERTPCAVAHGVVEVWPLEVKA